MRELFEKQAKLLRNTQTGFVRSLLRDINWKARLIGIKGARGVGKTTLLLQYIKLYLNHKPEKVLYISLDHIWFSDKKLYDIASDFVRLGGEHLFIDEVHYYENWAQEIKNIYDDFSELQIVFTGSSLLKIIDGRIDLSRRAVIYPMQGLSLREYINLETGMNFQKYSLEEILENHIEISQSVLAEIKPFPYFRSYLEHGYLPFYREEPDLYSFRLNNIINFILEIELPLLRNIEISYVRKIKQLLMIIAETVPFSPQISAISRKMGINRITLLRYLHYLAESGLLIQLYKDGYGVSKLQKPDKIFLENTNYMYVLSDKPVNTGNIRETFFVNQVGYRHQVLLDKQADFKINDKWVFEVGGKNKTGKQISGLKYAFLVLDDMETGFQNKIPLWLFGFLY